MGVRISIEDVVKEHEYSFHELQKAKVIDDSLVPEGERKETKLFFTPRLTLHKDVKLIDEILLLFSAEIGGKRDDTEVIHYSKINGDPEGNKTVKLAKFTFSGTALLKHFHSLEKVLLKFIKETGDHDYKLLSLEEKHVLTAYDAKLVPHDRVRLVIDLTTITHSEPDKYDIHVIGEMDKYKFIISNVDLRSKAKLAESSAPQPIIVGPLTFSPRHLAAKVDAINKHTLRKLSPLTVGHLDGEEPKKKRKAPDHKIEKKDEPAAQEEKEEHSESEEDEDDVDEKEEAKEEGEKKKEKKEKK